MNQYKLSKRIGEVRELAHLSQAGLAKRLDVSPSLVSHWEAGTRVPSQTQVLAMAQALGVALDYLLNAEVRPRFQFRAKAKLTAQQEAAVEKVMLDASQQVFYLDEVFRAQGKPLKPFSLKADFSHDQVRNLATQFRDALRLNRRVTLEELKQALTEWNVFVFEWAMPVQVSGLSYRGATTVIIINSLHTKQRKLFTLAHEFAHVLFHLGRDSQDTMVSVIASIRDPLEKEANAFASELLMPAADIEQLIQTAGKQLKQQVSLGMAAKAFNVSVDAMFYRLTEHGIFRWDEKKDYIPAPPNAQDVPERRVTNLEEQVSGEYLQAAISLHENEKASAGKLAEWFFAARATVEDYLADLSREQDNGMEHGDDET